MPDKNARCSPSSGEWTVEDVAGADLEKAVEPEERPQEASTGDEDAYVPPGQPAEPAPEYSCMVGLTPLELMQQARERQRLAATLEDKPSQADEASAAAERTYEGWGGVELTPHELMRQARERQRLAALESSTLEDESSQDATVRPPMRHLDTLRERAKTANMEEPSVSVREHDSRTGYVCTIYVSRRPISPIWVVIEQDNFF